MPAAVTTLSRAPGAFVGGALLALIHGAVAVAGELPDPTLTPGVLNPAVSQATIRTTICVRGWTSTVRPPVAYTNALKRQQLAEYGYADRDARHYEEDHRVPLGVGGHPTDRRNLWPEPRYGEWSAERKDELEAFVNHEVCSGRMTLQEGQAIFLGDWIAAYQRYLGDP
jgi:hypothetical protein